MVYSSTILTEEFCKKHEIMIRFVIPKNKEAIEKFLPIQKKIYDMVLEVSGMVMISKVQGHRFNLFYPKICDILVYDLLVFNGFAAIN